MTQNDPSIMSQPDRTVPDPRTTCPHKRTPAPVSATAHAHFQTRSPSGIPRTQILQPRWLNASAPARPPTCGAAASKEATRCLAASSVWAAPSAGAAAGGKTRSSTPETHRPRRRPARPLPNPPLLHTLVLPARPPAGPPALAATTCPSSSGGHPELPPVVPLRAVAGRAARSLAFRTSRTQTESARSVDRQDGRC